jgi:hypothetical protein
MEIKLTYYFCHEDSFGQRTGTYGSINLGLTQIGTDKRGNMTYGGKVLYKTLEEVLTACQS